MALSGDERINSLLTLTLELSSEAVPDTLASKLDSEGLQLLSETVAADVDDLLSMAHAAIELSVLRSLVLLANKEISSARRYTPDARFAAAQDWAAQWSVERVAVYTELITRAYGRTVVLSGQAGIVAYHIAQANIGLPEIGVINRLAPIAAALMDAEVGNSIVLPRGTYKVIAVGLLQSTPLTPSHVSQDFKSLDLVGYDLFRARRLEDLWPTLLRWREDLAETLAARDFDEQSDQEEAAEAHATRRDLGLLDGREAAPISYEARSALAASFYTNTTAAQERVIRVGPRGPVAVLGVAGSGKTSVALGRTKALHDQRYSESVDNPTEVARFFDYHKCVGFVLNSQLVDYLKDTRDQLAMHDMPVKEYHELRSALRVFRQIGKNSGFRRRGPAESSETVGQIEWLRAADTCVARHLARQLDAMTGSEVPDLRGVPPQYKAVVESVWHIAMNEYRRVVARLTSKAGSAFQLEGLYRELGSAAIRGLRQLDRGGIWLSVGVTPPFYVGSTEDGIAAVLRAAGFEVGTATHDGRMTRLLSEREQVEFVVKRFDAFRSYDTGPLVAADLEDLSARLRDNHLEWRDDKGRWQTFEYHDGLAGRLARRGELRCRREGSDDWEQVTIIALTNERALQLQDKISRGLQRRFIDQINIESAYASAVLSDDFEEEVVATYGDKTDRPAVSAAVTRVRDALRANEFTDADIDVLLAMAHLMSVGNKRQEPGLTALHMREPTFFAHVFIDEFQDFSEVQVFLMSEQADPSYRSITVSGDLRQQLTKSGLRSVGSCLPRFKPETIETVMLLHNKRQAEGLARFSDRFRQAVLRAGADESEFQATGVSDATVAWQIVTGQELPEAVARVVLGLPDSQSIAVICPNRDRAKALDDAIAPMLTGGYRDTQLSDRRDLCRPFFVHVTTPVDVKGLEFDVVIVPEFHLYDFADPISANWAYVAITRARHRLFILAAEVVFDGILAETGLVQH